MKIPFSKKPNNEGEDKSRGSERAKEFARRVADFFDAEPQKEKVLRHEDFHRAGDTYYATVSARYKIGQRISVLLLVLFTLFSVLTNVSSITYGNLFYFFRDFGNAVDIASVNYETLSYDVYKNQNFLLFRGGIAALSPTNVSLYTATGRKTLKSRSSFVHPYGVASNKYLLVYDTSGKSFAIYNSFSKVYTEEYAYPITDACIAKNGIFAVVSSSSEYKTQINVYDDDMKLIGRYSKNLYCFDVAMDKDGERMAALFYDIGDGRGATTLRVYDISDNPATDSDGDEQRILYEQVINYVFPLGCSFLENGKLSLVTDGSVTLFDKEYDVEEKYEYSGDVAAFSATENGIAVAVKDEMSGMLSRIIAFDKKGALLYNEKVNENVLDIGIADRYIFLKTNVGVVRLDSKNAESELIECQSGKMLVYDESTAIVCGESKAVYTKFEGR